MLPIAKKKAKELDIKQDTRPNIEPLNMPKEHEEIVHNLKKLKSEIDQMYDHFEYVTDPDLVDSCIYELKSLQKKYQYLLKVAKQNNIHIS